MRNYHTALKKKASMMGLQEKYCVLMWDEMTLSPHVEYDASDDVIIGFQDWGKKERINSQIMY